MPRKRKAARGFQKTETAHAAVSRKFALDSLELMMLQVENFHRELPTEAERRAFAEIHPGIFYELYEFEVSEFDKYPASSVVAMGCCFFRRTNFLSFLTENPPRTAFSPPDLTGVAYRDRQATMAKARMEWWKSNGWEMTDAEHRWAIYGPKARVSSENPGPMPLGVRSVHPRWVSEMPKPPRLTQ